MNKRHRHADVIIAWANGEDVQVRNSVTGEWADLRAAAPTFNGDEYRVKPKPVIRKYRVALFIRGSGIYTSTVDSDWDEHMFEEDDEFVRWLTDWIEYKVEE